MKEFRAIHIGDPHLDQKYLAKIEPALKQILEYCENVKVNAAVIPGDIWHCKQSYSNSSAIPLLFDFLRKLSKLVDFIFITKGNHDEPGSIALLHQLEPNIYAYEYPVCLGMGDGIDSDQVVDLLRSSEGDLPEAKYIVSLIPYPTKSMFLSDDSIDNNNAEFVEKFEQVFELIGETTKEYSCPKILGFHGNVVGSRLSSGQTLQSQDIMVATSTLEKANADYYALNHIHLRQEIKPNMIYAGGIANFNWGETEQKSFEVIEFTHDHPFEIDGILRTTTQVWITSARPMIKLDVEYIDNDFWTEAGKLFDCAFYGEEYRIRITIKENERNLITEDKIAEIKKRFSEDVKIEFNIVPTERESRSEQIMHCTSLISEVKEYAAVTEQQINGSIESKVMQLQEEVQL